MIIRIPYILSTENAFIFTSYNYGSVISYAIGYMLLLLKQLLTLSNTILQVMISFFRERSFNTMTIRLITVIGSLYCLRITNGEMCFLKTLFPVRLSFVFSGSQVRITVKSWMFVGLHVQIKSNNCRLDKCPQQTSL